MSPLPYLALVVWTIPLASPCDTTSTPNAKDNLETTCSPMCSTTPECNSESVSIFAKDPVVTTFTRRCLRDAFERDILRQAFDFSQTTVREYADFLREYGKQFLLKLGVEKDNADSISEFMARNLKEQIFFEGLTLPVVARFYCNTAANILFVNDVLTLKNAEDISWTYIKSILDSVNATMSSDPTSKFPATADGFSAFFASLGLFSKKNSQIAGYYIGNEWFVASVNYRCL